MFTELADGKTDVSDPNLREYIQENVTNGQVTIRFAGAINAAAEEAPAEASPEEALRSSGSLLEGTDEQESVTNPIVYRGRTAPELRVLAASTISGPRKQVLLTGGNQLIQPRIWEELQPHSEKGFWRSLDGRKY